MGMSGSFKIVPMQASYIFSTSGPQKTQKKGSLRILTNYSNAKKFKGYPGYANGKLTSRAFRKCGGFCCYIFLNQSYGCSKSTEYEILSLSSKFEEPSKQICGVKKNKYCYNFPFHLLPFNQPQKEIATKFRLQHAARCYTSRGRTLTRARIVHRN